MLRQLRTCLVALCCCLPPPALAASLRVVVTPDVLADYQRLLDGRSPLALTRFQGPGARRDVVEVVLLQQALARGGERGNVELLTAPTYRRLLALIADGHADVSGSSVWGSDIDANAARLQASSALVADGQFLAGFYRSPATGHLDERIRNGQWRGLTAVSSKAWTPDWLALQRLGLDHVYDAAEWPVMVRMVGARRADFLLAPLPGAGSPDIRLDGTRLVPVSGACLVLPGSRHFAIGRHATGNSLRQALERGLELLRSQGVVRRAYLEAGFLRNEPPPCHHGG